MQTFNHPTTDIKSRCQIYPKNEIRKLRRFRNHFSSCPTEMFLEKNCEESYPRETQSTIRLEQLDGDIIIIIIIIICTIREYLNILIHEYFEERKN